MFIAPFNCSMFQQCMTQQEVYNLTSPAFKLLRIINITWGETATKIAIRQKDFISSLCPLAFIKKKQQLRFMCWEIIAFIQMACLYLYPVYIHILYMPNILKLSWSNYDIYWSSVTMCYCVFIDIFKIHGQTKIRGICSLRSW